MKNYIKKVKSRLSILVKIARFRKSGVLIPFSSYIEGPVIIGYGTRINGRCYIKASKEASVIVGRYCAIAHNMRIRSRNHQTRYPNLQDALQDQLGGTSLDSIKGPTVIGNNVWIADNVIILPGVNVGDGSVIGAGSVVTKSVEPFSIVAGCPAKFIKYRFNSDVRSYLSKKQWWFWDRHRMENNQEFFSIDFAADGAIEKANQVLGSGGE